MFVGPFTIEVAKNDVGLLLGYSFFWRPENKIIALDSTKQLFIVTYFQNDLVGKTLICKGKIANSCSRQGEMIFISK